MQSNTTKSSLLRLPQVLQRFPVCKSTWWAGVRDGKYPKPVKMKCRCTAWRESDIDQLIQDVSEEADDE
jgi:prophage regulatory protein